MSFENILYEKRDGIATITINRPTKLNAFNFKTLRELKAAIDDAEMDNDVRVVVIKGAGDRAFSAGADIETFQKSTLLEAREFVQLGHDVARKIEALRKPVIAAINGYALGGGCELALACDIRIASENAKLGQTEINIGIIPGWGGTQRLTQLVGATKAKELIFTGDIISAREAERINLVNKVVSAEELNKAVEDFCEKLKKKSPVALELAKSAINRALEPSVEAGLRYEAEAFTVCFSTEDRKEGVTAFLEKRKPVFKGK